MRKNIGQQIAARDFNKQTVRTLARGGVHLQGIQNLPGDDGSYANGVRGYEVSDNGTGRILLHGQVLAIAKQIERGAFVPYANEGGE
jgi:hypothetical protein